jgi:hypothetical protein
MANLPEFYSIGHKHRLERVELEDLDPRGLVCMWEPPNPRGVYVMGIDPTVGITGWDRHNRSKDDFRIDNGAIEIIRVGSESGDRPDVQVCEYAAPIDPEDLADVANALGRLYCGHDESEQCLCIIEVYPGPGLLTQRKLINVHGYTNHFVWKYLDTLATRPTMSLGWQSSPKSVRDLWIRGTRHISRGQLIIKSKWLAEELSDCEADLLKMTAKASYGRHDDRVRAMLMSTWAAHDWSFQIEFDTPQPISEDSGLPNWQASDCSYDKMMDSWNDRFSELTEGKE